MYKLNCQKHHETNNSVTRMDVNSDKQECECHGPILRRGAAAGPSDGHLSCLH